MFKTSGKYEKITLQFGERQVTVNTAIPTPDDPETFFTYQKIGPEELDSKYENVQYFNGRLYFSNLSKRVKVDVKGLPLTYIQAT